MPRFHRLLPLLFIVLAMLGPAAHGGDIGLLPKYGSLPKNEAQKAADQKFIAEVDRHYRGDRRKAAADITTRGWQFLRQGDRSTAMRRFNQAWLLDPTNGNALWGMAAVSGGDGNLTQSLALFLEAQRHVGDDIDFAVDYARAVGFAGAERRDNTLVQNAFSRFAQIHERAPQHTLNLQNWAITLFYVGNYAEAWKKIKLAEATPRRAEIDANFVAALQGKMPRP